MTVTGIDKLIRATRKASLGSILSGRKPGSEERYIQVPKHIVSITVPEIEFLSALLWNNYVGGSKDT